MADVITITAGPTAYRVYEHINNVLPALELTGTWDTTGTFPDAIEYRLHIGASPGNWQIPPTYDIDPGGNWAIDISDLPAGPDQSASSSWYKIEVRSWSGQLGELATNLWPSNFGIGHVVALAGQSNAYYWANGPLSGSKTRTKATSSVTWNGTALVWTNSNNGQGAIAFADEMAPFWKTPVAIYNGAVSSSALWEQYKLPGGEWWLPDTSVTRQNFRDGIAALEGIFGIIWAQGHTDASNSSTRIPHQNGMVELFGQLRSEVGNMHLPFFVVSLGAAIQTTALDAWFSAVRDAQVTLKDRNTWPAAHHYDLAHVDFVHLTPASYETLALRVTQVVKAYSLWGAPARGFWFLPKTGLGPRIRDIRYTDATKTKIDVWIELRNGHTILPIAGTNVAGFQIWDDLIEVTNNIVSALKMQENLIQLTLNTAITGKGMLAYIYGTGNDGANQNKWLSSTVSDSSGMPLEPLPLPQQIQPMGA